MRIIFLATMFFLLISCGEDNFKKAEISECLRDTAANSIMQLKVEITEESDEMVMPDDETDDSDVIQEELEKAVILIEKTADRISFYYQALVACEGFEYGYEIEPDASDSTLLILYPKSKDIWPNKNVKCLCPKKMTVEYSNESQDLTKITKINVIYESGYDNLLEF